MTISTHYLLAADFEVLHTFTTNHVTGEFTATAYVSGDSNWVITRDIIQGRKVWRSTKASGGMVVSSEAGLDFINNGSV